MELRLEPAAVLPQQWPRENLFRAGGERRLMLAVLAEAVATFRRTASAESRKGQRLFAETAHWFGSDDGREPFAFMTICDTLGLDAEYIRAGLKRWRRRPASGGAEPPLSFARRTEVPPRWMS